MEVALRSILSSSDTSGWGLVDCPDPETNPYCSGGSGAASLQVISLPVASNSVCKASIGNYGRGKVFCWGGQAGHSGCFGDSGSPLMAVTDTGRHSLAGSVMGGTGPGCGGAGTWGLAWEAAVYRDWYMAEAGDEDVTWCSA